MSEKDDKAVVYSVKKGFLKKRVKNSNLTSNTKYIKITFSVLLLISIFIGIRIYLNQQQKKEEYEKSIQNSSQIKNTNKVDELVSNFGSEHDKNRQSLLKSNSDEWDKAKLDKTYFNLIYADKMGLFNEVYTTLYYIDVAEKSGLIIDDNSYGIDENARNQIKLRADKLFEARKAKVNQIEE